MKKTLIAILSLMLVLSMLFTGCIVREGTESVSESATESATESETESATESETDAPKPSKPITNANIPQAPYTERTPYTLTELDGPIGTGIGVNAGRVTWAYEPGAFNWNGFGYWWLAGNFDSELVREMIEGTICALAGEEDINAALDAIFLEFNVRVNGKEEGYKPGQDITIKGNFNTTGTSLNSAANTKGYFPAPVTVRALLEILVDYGVAPSDITVFDASRVIPTYMQELCSDGKLCDVRFEYAGSFEYQYGAPAIWSRDFSEDYHPMDGKYSTLNPAWYPDCIVGAEYIINLFNMRGHSLAGFTASAKNHFGTVIPVIYEDDGSITYPEKFHSNPPCYNGIHRYVSAVDFNMGGVHWVHWVLPKREMGTYNVLVDLMSNAFCGEKTVLYLCDALSATMHQNAEMGLDAKWYSAPFGDGTARGRGWTSSFFASQDPVAIDSVMYDFVNAELTAALAAGDNSWHNRNEPVLPVGHTATNYLIEAALAYNPPSGTYYKDGKGNLITSQGVHEHWNNDEEKLYSRNLGEDEGIELVRVDV